MTRAYCAPNTRLLPFLDDPDARGCHTVGSSVIRQPRLAAVITTSAVWYWSWTRWGRMSSISSARKARYPLEESVSLWDTMALRIHA